MAGVLTDHEDRAISADHLALLAHRLDGSSNLHRSGFSLEYRTPARPMSRTAGGGGGRIGRRGKIAGDGIRPQPGGAPSPPPTVSSQFAALSADKCELVWLG